MLSLMMNQVPRWRIVMTWPLTNHDINPGQQSLLPDFFCVEKNRKILEYSTLF